MSNLVAAYTPHVWATYEMVVRDLLNHMEEGISANNAALMVLDQWKDAHGIIIAGTKTLTNSQQFPFNNSKVSVALGKTLANAEYEVVIASAVSSNGANVGEIVVSERQANGFKMAHTGSASSVTVTYFVIGGFTE